MAHVSQGLDPILAELGDTLSPAWRKRLIKAFTEDSAHMLDRVMDGNGLTLVHGDPNPTNVLTRHKGTGQGQPLYLIDRQPFKWSLRLWLGASDLVYCAVPFWPEDLRRSLQKSVLQGYHQALVVNGIETYSWDDLQTDWRLCACMAAFTAIEWGSDPVSLKSMKWPWGRQPNRALLFLEDCDAAFPAPR